MKFARIFTLVAFAIFFSLNSWPQSAPAATPPTPADGARVAPPKAQPPVPTNATLWAMLTRRIDQIEFADTPLCDVFDRLAEIGDINIVPRWTILKKEGIARDHPITLKLKNVTFSDLIWAVFNQLDVEQTPLAFRAEPDFILISTERDLGREMIIKLYDAEVLVSYYIENSDDYGDSHSHARRSPPRNPDGSQHNSETSETPVNRHFAPEEQGDREYSTRDLMTPADFFKAADSLNLKWQREKQEYIRRLIYFITTTIEPDSWDTRGGPGSIVPISGRLVVRASGMVHQKLGGLLTAKKSTSQPAPPGESN